MKTCTVLYIYYLVLVEPLIVRIIQASNSIILQFAKVGVLLLAAVHINDFVLSPHCMQAYVDSMDVTGSTRKCFSI